MVSLMKYYKSLTLLVIPTGIEPVTPRLGIWCSILLSYGTCNNFVMFKPQPVNTKKALVKVFNKGLNLDKTTAFDYAAASADLSSSLSALGTRNLEPRITISISSIACLSSYLLTTATSRDIRSSASSYN